MEKYDLLTYPCKTRKLLTIKQPEYTFAQCGYALKLFRDLMLKDELIQIYDTMYFIEEVMCSDSAIPHAWVRVLFVKCKSARS